MNPDNLQWYLAGAAGLTLLSVVVLMEWDQSIARWWRRRRDHIRSLELFPACRHIYPVPGCKDCGL